MTLQVLYIKHMVCPRCIEAVETALQALGIAVVEMRLGKVTVKPTAVPVSTIAATLERSGFELIRNDVDPLVLTIQQVVIDMVRGKERPAPDMRTSEFIAWKVGRSYRSITRAFSTQKGMTLERYIILHKLEYAKELLEYGEHTHSEIAYKLGYKTVHHLANQFRAATGKSMSAYRDDRDFDRTPINEL